MKNEGTSNRAKMKVEDIRPCNYLKHLKLNSDNTLDRRTKILK